MKSWTTEVSLRLILGRRDPEATLRPDSKFQALEKYYHLIGEIGHPQNPILVP